MILQYFALKETEAKLANWLPTDCQIEHVPFGLVQGEDGKKLKTRSGETIRLVDLLDEAIQRARDDLKNRLNTESRSENENFIDKVSTTVGIASIKYADLSHYDSINQKTINRATNGN